MKRHSGDVPTALLESHIWCVRKVLESTAVGGVWAGVSLLDDLVPLNAHQREDGGRFLP